MVYGQHPFQAKDSTFAQKVVSGDYAIPAGIPVSAACLELLQSILVPEPKARVSMADIKQHPWFLQGTLSAVLKVSIKRAVAEHVHSHSSR